MVKKPEEVKKGLHCCLNDIPCEECPYNGQERCLRNALTDCHAYILTLEADNAKLQAQNAELVKQVETQVPKWISVKDRLPEEPGAVLVVMCGNAVGVAWYCNKCFETGSGLRFSAGDGVSHWMPLPEPPKEEQ